MKDWRGTPLVKGSIIVYPGRNRSHLWMMEGEVLEIHPDSLRVNPLRQGTFGRVKMTPVKITALERVTVVSNPSEVTANV